MLLNALVALQCVTSPYRNLKITGSSSGFPSRRCVNSRQEGFNFVSFITVTMKSSMTWSPKGNMSE